LVELLLLRHGIAEERRADRPDAERALTPLGRRRTRAVADRLVALGFGGFEAVSSPLVRAVQTAEIACQAGLLAPGCPAFRIDPALAPGADPGPLIWDLQGRALAQPPEPGSARRLLLVGHEPDLGDLVARLLGAPGGTIAVKKAGVALLSLAFGTGPGAGPGAGPGGCGAQLRLLAGPKQLLGP
jgi:phosphohistidine phosphatase